MQYAVIKTGGKQYKVAPGDVIEVERLTTEAGNKIEFGEVLLVSVDGESHFGFPHVADAMVAGKLVDHFRGEKIRVSRFKSKVRYRRVTGHRQELSRIQIDSFSLKGKVFKNETDETKEPQATKASSTLASTATVVESKKETKPKIPAKRAIKK